ncbi:hypothetical protein KPC83_06415 [Collinsella sp. zg1085]|uniref:hypothetical protein n=1 Tax=Collinsella sp. zg1085 TaxID=2844380 RepID=UPI001C0D22A6|nr:hypothetical protein [Collinsella sp. zg1085]QWT17464.1 hypothetical protein KPC83_06415 [Collinsella sp. zg1085]
MLTACALWWAKQSAQTKASSQQLLDDSLDEQTRETLTSWAEQMQSIEAEASSSQNFLQELNEAHGKHHMHACTWTSSQAFISQARTVLQAYQEQKSSRLITAGYLDLSGNVWGALIQGDDAWVDVVMVSDASHEQTVLTSVRVLRLWGTS